MAPLFYYQFYSPIRITFWLGFLYAYTKETPMIHIRNISDCHLLTYDPELQREVISYLLYCQYELQEYADDPESQEFSNFVFSVPQESDLTVLNDMLNDLGTPEETVQISIKADGHIITIYRIVYPTEVLFIPPAISDQFSL